MIENLKKRLKLEFLPGYQGFREGTESVLGVHSRRKPSLEKPVFKNPKPPGGILEKRPAGDPIGFREIVAEVPLEAYKDSYWEHFAILACCATQVREDTSTRKMRNEGLISDIETKLQNLEECHSRVRGGAVSRPLIHISHILTPLIPCCPPSQYWGLNKGLQALDMAESGRKRAAGPLYVVLGNQR